MLSQQETFKIAVLQSCAERGLTLPETHDVVKQALALLEEGKEASVVKDVATLGGLLPAVARPALDTAGWAAKTLGTGLLLAPFGIGAAGGYLAGRSRGQLTDEDIDEVKKRELIDTYRRVADEARRKSRVGANKQQRRSTPVRSLV